MSINENNVLWITESARNANCVMVATPTMGDGAWTMISIKPVTDHTTLLVYGELETQRPFLYGSRSQIPNPLVPGIICPPRQGSTDVDQRMGQLAIIRMVRLAIVKNALEMNGGNPVLASNDLFG